MDGVEPFDDMFARVRASPTIGALSSLCELAAHRLGFAYYTMLQPAMTGTPTSGLLLTNYPPDWIRQAVRNYNYLNSPVISLAAQTVMPFEWSELPYRLKLTASQLAYLRQTERMGIRSGFTVPIQNPNDPPGMVSFVSEQRRVIDDQTKALTIYLSMTAFQRAKELQSSMPPANVPQDAMTCGIVKLMLRGRSLRHIAEKLNIPVREVSERVEQAARHFPEGSNIAVVARVLYAPRPIRAETVRKPRTREMAAA